MLDFKNLRELGKGDGEGEGEKTAYFPPPFSFTLMPTPLVALSTLPNFALLLTSKMVAIVLSRCLFPLQLGCDQLSN